MSKPNLKKKRKIFQYVVFSKFLPRVLSAKCSYNILYTENYNKPEFDVVKIPEPVKTNFEVETANQYQGHQKIAAEKPPFGNLFFFKQPANIV